MRKVVSLGMIGMSQQCAQRDSARREAIRKENTEKRNEKEGNERIHHYEKGRHGPVTTRTACTPCLFDLVPEIARDTCTVY